MLGNDDVAWLCMQCDEDDCGIHFIATYRIGEKTYEGLEAQLVNEPPALFFESEEFDGRVRTLSPDFCAIYDEANRAEAFGLGRICGAGYRKALEFLIKDFLIRYKFIGNAEVAEQIATTPLAACIDRYVDDEGIKATAKRAAWVGNDETHYVRKWTDKDLSDLKDLIAITVLWVSLHTRLGGHLKSMPTGKP